MYDVVTCQSFEIRPCALTLFSLSAEWYVYMVERLGKRFDGGTRLGTSKVSD